MDLKIIRATTELVTEEKNEKQNMKNCHHEFPRLSGVTIQSYNSTLALKTEQWYLLNVLHIL